MREAPFSMGDPRVELVHRFFAGTGPTYDFVVKLHTLSFDIWWKQKILGKIRKGSTRILDQGCGTGILTFQIARKFPRSRVVGIELREEYLRIARQKARALRIKNVEFLLGRAEEVLLEEKFDCVTSSYLAKYAQLNLLVGNIHEMLSEKGILVMHDFTYPPNRKVARVWESYLRLLQKLGGWKYPQWREIYYGLPPFLRESRWVTELGRILAERGFSCIRTESLTFGTSAIVTAAKGNPYD
jgi:demethylmenaquinone methyltransferase/2-methoxy-6-polyprenyl-1,4-benzoquinol methylase